MVDAEAEKEQRHDFLHYHSHWVRESLKELRVTLWQKAELN